MTLNEALEQIIDGEVLNCTVIYKDSSDTETVSDYNIAMHGYVEGESDDDEIAFYCDGVDDFKRLLDPDNGEDFVVVSFVGRKTAYTTYETATYKADGWTLTLHGSMVGGRWEYTATDPNGNTHDTGNEWSFVDSDGIPTERPVIPNLVDVVFDAVNCLTADCDLKGLPEDWERVE